MSPHRTQEPNKIVDLAIVGGGPTGLLSALLARQLGLSVEVFDAKDGPLQLGRADALNARTQQYLEVVGILDPLLPQGLKCNTSSTFENGVFTTQQSHWWTSLSHCHHKNFLMIGQPVIEQLLTAELDVAVHYDSPATLIEETDSYVIVKSGDTEVRAKYLIAADGAKSFIRNALQIGFTGEKPEMVWAVLDTFIETDFPVCPEIVTFQYEGQARVSWIPRERGMARFYVLLPGDQVTQPLAEESIRTHMAPHKVEFKKTEWFSTFDVKERVASTFISSKPNGRILLAGDAAHVHSVNGGQGLNTGIADAFALAWRIAFTLRYPKATKLLTSYDSERRGVAQGVIDVAAKLVRSTIKTAKEYVGIIEKNAGYITGMGVEYPSSGEIISHGSFGPFNAGKRCPDVHLDPIFGGAGATAATTESSRLYSLVRYGKFLVLQLSPTVSAKLPAYLTDAAEIWEIYPEDVRARLVCSNDYKKFRASWVKEGESTTVVVRPDMYVGYVGQEWMEYLTSVFN